MADYGTVLQFGLPFGGIEDRVRELASVGRVAISSKAGAAAVRFDISDVLIERALKRCQLIGRSAGASKGECKCVVRFNAKGFRDGGSLSILITEGRVVVTDFRWDDSHD